VTLSTRSSSACSPKYTLGRPGICSNVSLVRGLDYDAAHNESAGSLLLWVPGHLGVPVLRDCRGASACILYRRRNKDRDAAEREQVPADVFTDETEMKNASLSYSACKE
jgi:hypothetical protein